MGYKQISPRRNQPNLSIKFAGAIIRFYVNLGEFECHDVQS